LPVERLLKLLLKLVVALRAQMLSVNFVPTRRLFLVLLYLVLPLQLLLLLRMLLSHLWSMRVTAVLLKLGRTCAQEVQRRGVELHHFDVRCEMYSVLPFLRHRDRRALQTHTMSLPSAACFGIL
jgi:hypothetical protein